MASSHAAPARGGLPKLEIKRSAADVSSLTDTGTFEGYASLFNVVDLGRDLIVPGAFRDSLKTCGLKGIKLLWQHDAAQPIGQWLALQEDQKGLKVRGQLNLAVARAREVYALMKDGSVDGLSIGFRAEKAVSDPATGVRRLSEVDLWEISIVTFPMLPQARVSVVKQAAVASVSARLARAIEAGTRNFSVCQCKLYNPSQPRDDHGRWTGSGSVASKKDDCIEKCYPILETPNYILTEDMRYYQFQA